MLHNYFFLVVTKTIIVVLTLWPKRKFTWFTRKRKLETIEINKFVIKVCLNSCIQSSLWLANLKFTKISSFLTQRKINPWKLSPPTSSITKSFEIFRSHEKTLGKLWLSEFRTKEKDCWYFGLWHGICGSFFLSLLFSCSQVVKYFKSKVLNDKIHKYVKKNT